MKLFGAIVVSGLFAMGCSSSSDETPSRVVGGSGGNAGVSPTTGGTGGASNPTDTGGKSPIVSTAQGGTSGLVSVGGATSGGATSGGTPSTDPVAVKKCPIAATLKEAAACNNKLIGAAITQGKLSNTDYTTAAKEHNFVTAENEMKWETIEPTQGNFVYGPGDAIVDFATTNGMKIKGHTLVWHSQLASWVGKLTGRDAVLKAMNDHITNVMTKYKGKIHAWDVVNEAWETPNKNGDGTAKLRESVFKTQIGDDYIDLAFKKAKEIDPSALLFYNDYSTEGMNDKSNAVYEMVKSMKERNIPIDGVGIQMHIGTPNDSPTAAEVKQNMDRIAALGLQIMISEFDVNGCDGFTPESTATLYHDITAACVAQPLCSAITIWGIQDSASWLNSFNETGCTSGEKPMPLLWDDDFKKKGTYDAVIKALTGN